MSYYGAHSRMARLALEKVENDHNMAQMDKTHVIFKFISC
jgi:hypothetical protein